MQLNVSKLKTSGLTFYLYSLVADYFLTWPFSVEWESLMADLGKRNPNINFIEYVLRTCQVAPNLGKFCPCVFICNPGTIPLVVWAFDEKKDYNWEIGSCCFSCQARTHPSHDWLQAFLLWTWTLIALANLVFVILFFGKISLCQFHNLPLIYAYRKLS